MSLLGGARRLASPFLRLSPLVLSGRYVAFVHQYIPTGQGEITGEPIYRLDIKTGRRMQLGEGPHIDDVVLTPKGTVAWISGEPGPGGGVLYEVRVGKPPSRFGQVVASSSTIDPHSLATAGGYLYWTEAGEAREARVG